MYKNSLVITCKGLKYHVFMIVTWSLLLSLLYYLEIGRKKTKVMNALKYMYEINRQTMTKQLKIPPEWRL